uniref:Plethodontid modulating factor n=1 Tax=Plethodon shermani TaxID=263671 RepID=Q0GAZ1_9SALA|nr:plethodontid modulating factor [Plethodon shermani]ABI48625.1 plethodontid modulating factor [Plethodon shermani]AEO22568.1 plethodontid modulating factor precursor [Plethodon shermani]
MRTTALLILLVVLASTGEALQCNIMDGGTEACPPGEEVACMYLKYEEEEFKACGPQELCAEMEDSFTPAESEHATFRCCTEDLCN